jgi:hypothetical protein
LCPEKLSDHQRDLAFAWAERNGFTREQLAFAFQSLRRWSAANGKKRVDWYAALQNAMYKGWVLEGFRKSADPSLSPAEARQERTIEAVRKAAARPAPVVAEIASRRINP